MITVLDPILAADALAADGSIVHLRVMTAADAAAVRALHLSVSGRNLQLRFFAESPGTAELYAARLAQREPDRGQVVLLAEQDGRLVGVGSYEPLGHGAAEIAFLLKDSHHGLGIGTLLLEHLAAAARACGITQFRADVLAENSAMLRVLTDSGFTRSVTTDGPVTTLVLGTDLTALTVDQILFREERAGDLSLASLLAPRTVAVVGFGFDAQSGREQVQEIQAGGFVGTLVVVNHAMAPVRGLVTYPFISAVPGRVDLAILTAHATQVAGLVEECALAGVRSVVITAASAAIGGILGTTTKRALVATARRYGTRVVGPGSLGVLNTAPGVALNVARAGRSPRPGGLSMAVQSGAVGRAVCDHADRTGVGLAEFVSLGEKADVSGNDLLLHWWREPRTRVIGMQLDSFGNPRKFARITRLVARDKPILVVLGDQARTEPDPVVAAVFAQSGVLRLDSVPELLDVARVLSDQPLPAGGRLAVVGNSGGLANLAASSTAAAGLIMPEFSLATQQELHDLAPSGAVSNPVDLGPDAGSAALSEAVRVVLASGEVDAILVTLSVSRLAEAVATLAEVCTAASANPAVPILAACVGAQVPGLFAEHGIRLPVFEFPELAVRALGHAAGYAAWRRSDPGTVPVLAGADVTGARAAIRAHLATHAQGLLPPSVASTVLRLMGFGFIRPRAGSDPGVRRPDESAGLSITMTRDTRFGPILGLGSSAGASLGRVLRGLPLTDVDAAVMVSSWAEAAAPVGPPVLGPGRLAAELTVLHRVALLAERVPEITELLLDPVPFGPTGVGVGEVRIHVANVAGAPDPLLRRLP